ncbi:Methionine aminopeptidase 1D chloroplastic/mitochondrial [Zea mays]|uniref:Methionine aminopeptidase 1D chloroplastic/mitochondrial n=1 Tax=Zea mays TaxID=4577 RepID=A0A1D6M549_MAIZE|nr:Methionine aminopeptidase 1D chloroplastic/mitochondrial [Zea mays]
MVRALRLGGRAAAAVRWCTYRRAAVALCVANLVAVLLVARALYAPSSFAFAPKRGELKYSREHMRWVDESIRIRRAAEPVELIEAIIAVLRSSCVWNSICSEAIEAWCVGKLKDMRSTSSKNLSNFGLSSEDSRMLKRALEFNWQMLLEDIGLWIPPNIW